MPAGKGQMAEEEHVGWLTKEMQLTVITAQSLRLVSGSLPERSQVEVPFLGKRQDIDNTETNAASLQFF